MKKILIIDDSALMRRVISDIINTCDGYEVAATAKDGLQGFEMILSQPKYYDAIILDINMPRMNGLELLAELQKNGIEQTVIVVSTVAKEGAKEAIQALELGAFDFVTKPENYLETKSDEFKDAINNMLNIACEANGIIDSKASFISTKPSVKSDESQKKTLNSHSNSSNRTTTGDSMSALERLRLQREGSMSASEREKEGRTPLLRRTSILSSAQKAAENTSINASEYRGVKPGKKKLVALACSTGGPKSLQMVIPKLPKNLDAPMIMVQHMPAGFTASLALRLNELSEVTVTEAKEGDVLEKGHVYLAPGGKHMKISNEMGRDVIKLSDEPPVDGLRPCANIMYESLSQVQCDEITCVVLTGMGSDGTKGIKGLSASKNLHVIAQDEKTCVVYGMPKAVAQSGLVDEVVPLDKVAETITKNVGVS